MSLHRAVCHLAYTLILLGALAGCHKGEEHCILDTIPANAPAIVAADLDQLLKMAGCRSHNGAISLTPQLKELLGQMCPDALPAIEAAASQGLHIDLAHSYGYTDPLSRTPIFTSDRKSSDELHATPVLSDKSKKLGRYKVYAFDHDISMLVAERQAWIAHASPDSIANLIELSVSIARNHSVEPELRALLLGNSTFAGRVACDIDNPLGDDIGAVLFEAQLSDRTLRLKAWANDSKNRQASPFAKFCEVDSSALMSLPDGSLAAVAIGLEHSAIKALSKLSGRLPIKYQLSLQALLSMFAPSGGTVAVATAPGGNAETIRRFSYSSWLFKILLPLGDNTEFAASLVDKLMPQQVYCESIDDYLSVTNFDPEEYPADANLWGENYAGAQAILTASIPYKSPMMKALRLSNGYQLRAFAADSAVHASLRLLGESQYLLPSLIDDANRLINHGN